MRAEELPPECSVTRAVNRPRAMCRLMTSRICASSISISRGRFTEISLCLRFTELSSTVILKPSCEQSPRPYPVIDFIQESMRKRRQMSNLELESERARILSLSARVITYSRNTEHLTRLKTKRILPPGSAYPLPNLIHRRPLDDPQLHRFPGN